MYPNSNKLLNIHNDSNSWACPKCTLLNSIHVYACDACGYNQIPPNMTIVNVESSPYRSPLSSFSSMLRSIKKSTSNVIINNITKIQRDLSLNLENEEFFVNKWECKKCDFINDESKIFCEICNNDRSSLYITSNEYMICGNCNYKTIFYIGKKNCPYCFNKMNIMKDEIVIELNNSFINCLEYESLTLEQSRHTRNVYQNIYNDCVQNNVSFIDDSFPHSKRSIGTTDDPFYGKIPKDIVWLRPAQIFTKDGSSYRWAVFRDTNLLATDIEQGLLGNCWFLSALAVCTERIDILKKIFVTPNYQHNGIYVLSLCIDGMWQNIIIDDFFPCFKGSNRQIFAVGRRNQLWVPLIEKAFAKAYGSYAMLSAGMSAEGFSALTGAPTQHITLKDEMYLECSDMLWVKIVSSKEAGFLIGCSAGNQDISDVEYMRVGLQKLHGYSFLDAVTLYDGTKIVKLRNPWGKFVWNKEYSDNWKGWKNGDKHLLFPKGPEAGVFCMPFYAFCKYFTSIEICKIRNHWKEIRIPLKVCNDWSNISQLKTIKIIILEETEATFVLHQTNSRSKNSLHDLQVVIFEENPVTGGPGNVVAYSDRNLSAFVVTEDMFLKKGIYLIAYFSFYEYGNELKTSKNNDIDKCDLILSIHSSKTIHASVLPASSYFYQRCLSILIKTHGKCEHTSISNIMVYKMNQHSCGIITYVENISKNKCAYIECNVGSNNNLLRTRIDASTFDAIPPFHGMIIHIFTQMEPTQSYQLEYSLICQLRYFDKDIISKNPRSNSNQNFPNIENFSLKALHAPFPII
uniref:Calpain catalytic domain-containing protein n=1 Tax=Parastrongyloides trichosuri TaxID=131310 RepID=A0A0N4ZRZ8_PARTI